MSHDDAYLIRLGELARQIHFEMTGEQLQLLEMPCVEAMLKAAAVIREADDTISSLTK